jgi:hypothetical protein
VQFCPRLTNPNNYYEKWVANSGYAGNWGAVVETGIDAENDGDVVRCIMYAITALMYVLLNHKLTTVLVAVRNQSLRSESK